MYYAVTINSDNVIVDVNIAINVNNKVLIIQEPINYIINNI